MYVKPDFDASILNYVMLFYFKKPKTLKETKHCLSCYLEPLDNCIVNRLVQESHVVMVALCMISKVHISINFKKHVCLFRLADVQSSCRRMRLYNGNTYHLKLMPCSRGHVTVTDDAILES